MIRTRGLELLAVLSLCAAAQGSVIVPPSGPQTRWALLIGIDQDKSPVTAEQQQIANLLRSEYGYQPEHVSELYNEAATPDAIRSRVAEMSGRVKPADSVFAMVALPQRIGVGDPVALPWGVDTDKPWLQISTGDFTKWLAQIRARSALTILPICGMSSKAAAYALEELRYAFGSASTVHVAAVCEEEPGAMSQVAVAIHEVLSRAGGRVETQDLLQLLNERLSRRLYIVASGNPADALSFVRERSQLAEAIGGLSAGAPRTREAAVRRMVEIVAAEPAESRGRLTSDAMPHLVRALNDTEAPVRLAAVWAVGELRLAAGVTPLATLFANTDVETRAAIAAAAGRIGGADAAALVHRALRDDTPAVRAAAVRAAVALDEPSLAASVIAAGQAEVAEDVQLAVLQAAPKLRADRAALLAFVRAGLASPLPAVRRQAIVSWGELGEALPLEPFTAIVRSDPDANVRQTAVYAFGRAAVPQEQRGAVTALLVGALRNDSHPRVREGAAWSLGRIADPAAERALIEALRRESDTLIVRVAAADALGNLKSARAVEPLMAVLRRDQPELRRAAARALGLIGDAAALPVLFTAASDSDAYVRAEATAALERLNPEARSTAILLRSLDDKSPATRVEAVEKLAAVPTDAVSLALTRRLGDPSPEVRNAVIRALAKFDDPATRQRVGAAFASPDLVTRQSAITLAGELRLAEQRPAITAVAADETVPGPVRAEAVRALGKIESDLAPLLRAAQDKDPLVREAAAEVLSRHRSDAAIEELKRLSRDDAPNVRDKAISALRAIPSAARKD